MFKKLIYFSFFASIITVVGLITLKNNYNIGPVILILTILPISALLIAKRSLKSALPDIIFGSIDTGLLTIPALTGGIYYGVAGAIAGGIIGDSLTDGIAGFFEGSLSEWLRKKGIEESREGLTTSLGKMAGCLFGSGIILTIALLFGVSPKFN